MKLLSSLRVEFNKAVLNMSIFPSNKFLTCFYFVYFIAYRGKSLINEEKTLTQ